ncbi:MAG: hypothetical protein KDD35_01285, partial [Bdellovibrionales bacterium]|nr:hypothetical protein [Bdellovibrionales bacterium]
DSLIEKKVGKTISEIFSSDGEDYFRQQEQEILLNFNFQGVMSLGGGALTRVSPLELKKKGRLVYLRASPSELLKRLKSQCELRPLLSGKSEKERETFVRQKLAERQANYQMSDLIIDVDGLTPDKVVDLICQSEGNLRA